jgi:hypothetical protein
MKLITISDNILVNPNHITSVEVRVAKGTKSYYVICGSRSYKLEIDIAEFLKSAQETKETPDHHFAG